MLGAPCCQAIYRFHQCLCKSLLLWVGLETLGCMASKLTYQLWHISRIMLQWGAISSWTFLNPLLNLLAPSSILHLFLHFLATLHNKEYWQQTISIYSYSGCKIDSISSQFSYKSIVQYRVDPCAEGSTHLCKQSQCPRCAGAGCHPANAWFVL